MTPDPEKREARKRLCSLCAVLNPQHKAGAEDGICTCRDVEGASAEKLHDLAIGLEARIKAMPDPTQEAMAAVERMHAAIESLRLWLPLDPEPRKREVAKYEAALDTLTRHLQSEERLREALRALAEEAARGSWDAIACRPSNRRPPNYRPVILPDLDGKTMPQRWVEWALAQADERAALTPEDAQSEEADRG